MTLQQEIDHQIEILEVVTQEICKSKESARQFLIDAGIFIEKKKRKTSRKKK